MSPKICFITNYAYRLFNPKSRIVFGGIETIFYLMARNLSRDKQIRVSFLLEDDVHRIPKTESAGKILLYKTSRNYAPKNYYDKQVEKYRHWFTYWAGKFSRLWQWPHLDFFRLWEKLKQIKAAVYIFASPGYESGIILLITKLIKKKSIFIVANDEILRNRPLFYILRFADTVICYSLRHQKILRRKYWIKAIYLPPWFPHPKKTLDFDARKYFFWVGRIEARKNPLKMIHLARLLPQINFLMVIAETPNEPASYQKILREAGRLPNVTIKCNVSFPSLKNYYYSAMALIDTSNYNHLNMTQIQAAWFKTPCLSLFYDPNDSFKQYGWGYCAYGRLNRLVKKINLLSNSAKDWKIMAENSYRFAKVTYDQKENLAKFKKLL